MGRKIKEIDAKTKKRREKKFIQKRNDFVLKKSIFIALYKNLKGFINKSSIKTFKKYLENFSTEKNWILISDYSFYNKKDENNTKKSNVYSYVLIPNSIVENSIEEASKNIKKDIKKIKKVPIEAIETLKNSPFFVFNFITEKDYLDIFFKKEVFDFVAHKKDLKKFIDFIKKDVSTKDNYIKAFQNLSSKIEKKSFNLQLYQKILLNSFFAAFISSILEKEIKVEDFYWISDRDPMFSYINDLPQASCYFRNNEMKEVEKIKEINHKKLNLISESIPESQKPSYDSLILYPDYFAGTLAEYEIDDLKSFNKNNKEKYKQMVENVFKNNENFVNIVLKNKSLEIYRLMISDRNNIMPNSIEKK